MMNSQDPRQEQLTMEEVQDTRPVAGEGAEPRSEGRLSTRQTIGIVLIVIVVMAIIGALVYGLATHPLLTAVVRDIAIITLALVTVILGLFVIVLIFQLQSLIALLRDEIKPILESANETASTVRGTTTFVSDAVVTPMIQVASLAAGVGQTFRTLTDTDRKRKRQTKSPPGPQGEA
jgi:hypothetical protein